MMNGIKDLGQMITNKFLILLVFCLIAYFISDYFFTYGMLYITGGLIGGTIKELLKSIGFVVKGGLIILIWLVLLITIAVMFYRVHKNVLRYILIFFVASLLYVFDFAFIEIVEFNVIDPQTGNLNIALRITIKGLVLASIVYLEQKRRQSRAVVRSIRINENIS